MAFDSSLNNAFPPSLIPHQKKMTLPSNYLSFNGGGAGDTDTFAQQYLPELYEAEVERYGNRTIGGFLRMVGAEMPMSSDQVIWSEQNRLHISYDSCVVQAGGLTMKVRVEAGKECVIRKDQTIVISDGINTVKALVTLEPGARDGNNDCLVTVQTYQVATIIAGGIAQGAAAKVFVYGSEFKKGTEGMTGSVEPDFTQFSNKPIILKDHFEINGSDAAQIGWVEVATEDGASGYLWYLKAESETRLRFEDYMEMSMVEAVKKSGGGISSHDGSEGLFAAIKGRGNVYQGFGAATAGTGALADFDEVLKGLDKEGSIEENMLFVNRGLALDIDDMLGQVNGGFSNAGAAQGASFGLFNNEAEMALNLGFSGFRRGSYDFYKSDWKYLNDAATRGVLGLRTDLNPAQTNTVEGVLVPAGTSTVYDQVLGQNIRRPFLHVRYRASETEDRRMKSWITGSVGGAYTSGLDAMKVHFLSERCLCTQGANNFVLFTS